MSKRKRFLATSILLSGGLIGIQFLTNENKFWAIGMLGIIATIMFYWSLWEGLGKNMTLLVLVLPVLFTVGVGMFWFLLPGSFFLRFPVIMLYGVGIYGWVSSANIYVVAAVTKTIPLLRTARGIGFVLTLFTSFLIYNAVISLRASLPVTVASVAFLSFLLFLQGLWSITLKTEFSKNIFNMSLIFSLIVGEVSASLYFWPATVVVGSLFLTVTVYMLLGLGQAMLEGRLFSQTVREHLILGILVFISIFFTTHWGGRGLGNN